MQRTLRRRTESIDVNQHLSGRRMSAIVLAAGKGSRMQSPLPKPLQLLDGQPMTGYVIKALEGLGVERLIIVVGHQGSRVRDALLQTTNDPSGLEFAEQKVQNGTAQAVAVALQLLDPNDLEADDNNVMVLPGDMPLLTTCTLAELKELHFASGAAATVLTAEFTDPSGYGRVVRDEQGQIKRIVEHADALPEELTIGEVNTSVYCFRSKMLLTALQDVRSENSQNEYYLTDVIELLNTKGNTVRAVTVDDPDEVRGVNNSKQLAECESLLMDRSDAK